MARLLVLSLAETNRNDNGYEVIARNIDDHTWVIIPALPKDLFFIDGKPAWDIFAVTEADLSITINKRSGVYDVETRNYLPKMIKDPIKRNSDRIKILEELSFDNKDALESSPEWVGILKKVDIKEIYYKERYTDNPEYDTNKTFFWECRIAFNDINGDTWNYRTSPGVSCKDMRFKAYWRDIFLNRREQFEESKEKWLNYMQINNTYLLIEFIPNDYYQYIAVVSGVLCINNQEEVF